MKTVQLKNSKNHNDDKAIIAAQHIGFGLPYGEIRCLYNQLQIAFGDHIVNDALLKFL